MFFNLSKAFVTLAAVAAVTASTVPASGVASCTLTLKPTVHVDANSANLDAEFNLVFARSLAIDTNAIVNNDGAHVVNENPDNTFVVSDQISAQGKTSAETGAIITGWVGETKQGFVFSWIVEAAHCA